MASESQHKHIVRFTLEWITKLLWSVALLGPGRRAPTVEALGAQAVLLHTANLSVFELAQPQLLGFRWSPPWFLALSVIVALSGSWLGTTMPATTAAVIVPGALRATVVGIRVLVHCTLVEAVTVVLYVSNNGLERRELITSR